jgi:hypothetical protein
MAVQLDKFNVPNPDGSSGVLVQPKLSYRFRVRMADFGNGDTIELTSQVVSVARPSMSHDDVTIDVYNSRIYLAGKHTWDPISLTVRDDVTGRVARAIAAQLQKQVDHADQSSANAGSGYKFAMSIENLDGGNSNPVVLDSWQLAGCYIQNVNYGENNYATSDALQITVSIRYDNANHIVDGTEALNGGVGTSPDANSPSSAGTAPE